MAAVISSDPAASEAGDHGQFFVVLDPPPANDVSVNFVVTGSMAQPGSDYRLYDRNADQISIVANTGSVLVPQAGVAPVLVAPIDDSVAEGREYIRLTLGSGTGYSTSTRDDAFVWMDADTNAGEVIPEINIAVTDRVASEPPTGQTADDVITFEVSATPPPASAINVSLQWSGTASATDFQSLPGNITIGTSGAATLTLTPIPDASTTDAATPEKIDLILSPGGGYAVGPESTARGFVIDSAEDTDLTIGISWFGAFPVEGEVFATSSDPVHIQPGTFRLTTNRVPPQTTVTVNLGANDTDAILGLGPGDEEKDFYVSFDDGPLDSSTYSANKQIQVQLRPNARHHYLNIFPITDKDASTETLVVEILGNSGYAVEPTPIGARLILISD